ncbi:MAG: ATP synthase F1 subunit epsilon [Candidatus Eremiobacteraeota bacterium]|nr:ATP synthase F1 subunit epsilon [Candidatus Eremiobacteraeota bacterium]
MASAVAFKLITPTEIVFEGEAELVIATGTEGEEGILAHHAPFLTALRPGVLRANVSGSSGQTSRLELATSEGFMQALPDRVTVIVDQALRFEDVDVVQTRQQLSEALERQAHVAAQSPEFAREQSAIDFANAKLRLTGH